MNAVEKPDTFITGPLYASRKKVYPQAVSGRFRRIKWAFMAFALGLYYLLPFVRWDRGPGAPNQAVMVDMTHRRFYFFFIELWPQEAPICRSSARPTIRIGRPWSSGPTARWNCEL
jgi:hypothetical protein